MGKILQPIPAELLRFDALPRIPEWFNAALADCVPRYKGKPMFRLVDGMREPAWLDGDGSYLKYTNNEYPCVPVKTEWFTRRDFTTLKAKRYDTLEQAEADTNPNLAPPIPHVHIEKKWIGKPCWIVEVLLDDDAMPTRKEWEQGRYKYLNPNGVERKVDLRGEYPVDGKYVYVMSVLDEQGRAIAPHQGIIDDLKRRFYEVTSDNRSVNDRIKDDVVRTKLLDQRVSRQMTEDFFGAMGISARRAFGAEISKPIRSNDGNSDSKTK